MNREIEIYLEAAYKKLKQGQFSIKESEEILMEQSTFLKIGLISPEEYGIWTGQFKSICSMRIDSMALSARGHNGLLRANVDTCGKLRSKILYGSSDKGLMMIRNLGEKTVCEIVAEAVQCSLVSKIELLQAPWSPGLLKKMETYLEVLGL